MASNSRGIVIVHAAAGLYVSIAMTRARLATPIVGQAAVVARAAATPDTSRRYSRLGERLSSPER
jgi:exodeoxyribonuclease V alpha subunit